jgi:hypothetical protein
VDDAAQRVWDAMLDESAFPGGLAEFTEVVGTYDRNGDGVICLKVMWGEDLNPNSHWYAVGLEAIGSPTEQFLPRDNNAGS